jgi:hypothetical protein
MVPGVPRHMLPVVASRSRAQEPLLHPCADRQRPGHVTHREPEPDIEILGLERRRSTTQEDALRRRKILRPSAIT